MPGSLGLRALCVGVEAETILQIFALALFDMVERCMDITERLFREINLLGRLGYRVNSNISVESDFILSIIKRNYLARIYILVILPLLLYAAEYSVPYHPSREGQKQIPVLRIIFFESLEYTDHSDIRQILRFDTQRAVEIAFGVPDFIRSLSDEWQIVLDQGLPCFEIILFG